MPATMLVSSCGLLGGPSKLHGGVLAVFEVESERFRVFVTKPSAIEQLLALQAGQSSATIPSGKIRRGPGQARHNLPYSWHLDPQDFDMAELTIELCDGRPSYVQAHVDEYVDVIGRYCPWGARLVELVDVR
jgi:hypothetical protein